MDLDQKDGNPTDEGLPSSALVRFTSCLDVAHADLVRIVLAEEGIRTAVGNANFLGWFWQDSNAVGGVIVYVSPRDAQRAREVFAAALAGQSKGESSWVCSTCRARVQGHWNVCWQCGRLADGTPSVPLCEEAMRPADAGEIRSVWQKFSILFGLLSAILVAMLLFRHGCGPEATLLVAPWILLVVYRLRCRATISSRPSREIGLPR